MKQFGIIKNGKLILNNRNHFNQQLIELEGKEVVIKVIERNNNRTKDQNSLFWKWVEIISQETGYTKEETKELISYKFLKRERIDKSGYIETYLKGTSTLSKKEFTDFMNEVSLWSNSTLNVILPSNE
tara:strand:+ start:1314 stop:1697 length:384 start_codon:yes stop_codon:yes gene_type:complete